MFHLPVSPEQLQAFCRQNHIARLSLFGSVLKGTAQPDSDLDLLVRFEPGHVPGLIRLSGIQNRLSDLLGRKVDLRTPGDLSRYFCEEVLQSSELLYAG